MLFNFLNKKSEKSFLMRRNPRKISWTVLYRKKNKKGTQEEVSKKRTRRNVKFQRAIAGATLESILAKKNMKPEVREAQRNQAIKAAKDKAKSKKADKKTTKKSQPTKKAPMAKATKSVQKGGPGRVGGKK